MEATAPEKIYIQPNAHDGWFETNNPNRTLTEYTRTDAFVEKAEEYLKEHLIDYWAQRVTDDREFVEDFRNYMKGEKL